MSNLKYAFGWSGHILARESEEDRGMRRLNCIAIPDDIFDRIATDMGDCKLPARIEIKQLGWLSIETVHFLAAGVGFTEAFEFYGAPFKEAESRSDISHELKYIAAMKRHYGLELPPCRLMIGCASEH